MSSAVKASSRLKSKRRPGDPWVSKNRVLNGPGKTKRTCPIYRNPNFDTDETRLLIQLWGDPKVQRELITTHKKHVVISQLSAKMEEYGYYRSPEEITTRIKNMKCFYNRLKKEMESCQGVDPSWRHYAEMDAIMTRPIFSVRPNEVPAPSLKYLLEQEQEKRRERKRKAEEEGDSVSDSDEDISDILAVPSAESTKSSSSNEADCLEGDGDIELEIDEETLAVLQNIKDAGNQLANNDKNQNDEVSVADPTLTEDELAIKMEMESEEFQDYNENETNGKTTSKPANLNKTNESNKTINVTENEDLLVPKVEPIDAEEPQANTGKQQQQSSSTPQMTNTLTHLTSILNQPTKLQNLPGQTILKFAMPTNSVATNIPSSSSSIPTQSKISVVSPTILMSSQMSPKSSADTNMSSRQVRLGGNIHALLAASGSRTTVTNANGMKFLLVNTADQNRGPPVTTSSVSSTLAANINLPTNQQNVQIIQNSTQFQSPQQNQQQQQQQQQNHQQQQQQQKTQKQQQASILKSKEATKRLEARQEYREQLKKRDLVGIKTTLAKLLKAQEDSNEIQSERLAIERERLQFERTVAEKFLTIFEQNQKTQQQQQQQPPQQQQQQFATTFPQQHFQIQQRSSTSPQVFTTNNPQNITSTGQIMMPPKLLITTMVPSSGQGVTGASASKVLTSANFASLAAKPSNDIQLLIPKEEPQN